MLRFWVLWALLAPAHAQVYKWVDEKGKTHYGERAPPGAKAQEVEQRLAKPVQRPRTATQPNWKEQDLEFRGRRIEAEQAEAARIRQETANRRKCNQARDHLVQMKSARRIYRLNEKGERVYQSDEENRAAIAKLERQISERCR